MPDKIEMLARQLELSAHRLVEILSMTNRSGVFEDVFYDTLESTDRIFSELVNETTGKEEDKE